MALPDFQKTQQDMTSVPVWARDMNDDEFISYSTTYPSKTYFDLFDFESFPCEETGAIRYYVYDPVKHGADPTKKYPVLMWLHGASNSIMGIGCIMCCGAEQYASPKYQEAMGGAYLIVPLANEERLPDGSITGGWSDQYVKPLKAILDKVCLEHPKNIGKRFVMGASSGGNMTWRLLEHYSDVLDGAIPIASPAYPSDVALDAIQENGVRLLIAHGQHDEMAPFQELLVPRLEKLTALKNSICFFPKWVYHGDGGISSVCYGREMGQHCMINWIQNNLVFDNGMPADARLPEGVTGWIRDVCKDIF